MASLIPKWVKKEVTDVWAGESLWLMLLTSAHSPAASQRYVAEVVANEIPASGNYVAGGLQVINTSSQPDVNNYYLDSAMDLNVGPNATVSYRYGVLYTRTGGSSIADYKIRAQIDFGSVQTVTNGTSTVQWNALGIIYVS